MGLTPRSYLDQMDELHERLQQAPVALRPPSVARIGFIGGGMGESDQTLGPDIHCPAIIFEKIIAAQAKPRGAAARWRCRHSPFSSLHFFSFSALLILYVNSFFLL